VLWGPAFTDRHDLQDRDTALSGMARPKIRIATSLPAVLCGVVMVWLLGPAVFLFAQATDAWSTSLKNHAWARFGTQAWKVTRLKTQSYNEQGKLERTSITITRTHVTGVREDSLSLGIQSTVAVEGQEFVSDPQEVTQRVSQLPESAQTVRTETLTIGEQKFSTEVIVFEVQQAGNKQVTQLNVCRETTPQVLKRVTKTLDATSNELHAETVVQVTELEAMLDVLGEKRPCWVVETKTTRPLAEITSREIYCRDVPGELVSRSSEERNGQGQLTLRRELEVTGYGFGNRRRRWFGRRRH
jgi:hypothetical protein